MVEDSGSGINEEHLAGVYESFSKADTSITRRYGGTGLGLALCKQLVDLMGGTTEASSTPNVGSTSTVVLQLATTT